LPFAGVTEQATKRVIEGYDVIIAYKIEIPLGANVTDESTCLG
jgi:hypothetical protein